MTKKGHIFISYARGDGSDFALRLYDDLEVRHINAWLDVHDIDPGEDFYSTIDRGIRDAIAIVVVLTPLAVLSAQVKSEWNSALNLHLPVIPLLVVTCEVPSILSILNWIDFRSEYDAGIAALRRRISRLFEDHLANLNEQIQGYRAAQVINKEPASFQPKIDDLTVAIKRWEEMFVAEQQREEQKLQYIQAATKDSEYRKDMKQVFVGRQAELERLNISLKKSLMGEMQVCLVEGEAGAGKSTLIDEFALQSQDTDDKLLLVIGNCNAQTGLSDPYLPFRQILALLTGDLEAQQSSGAITEKNAQRLQDILKSSGRALVEVAPELVGTLIPGAGLIVSLARLGARERGLLKGLEERAKKAESDKMGIDQSQIFLQYTGLLRTLAKEHPLVIVLDDLQWADAASIALLFHLTRELKDSRIFLIGLYRPNDVAAGRGGERHPLESVLTEVKRYYGDVWINLDGIQQAEGRAFVDAFIDSEPNTLDKSFRASLFHRTDGHPLFTIELIRTMQESGDLVKDETGRWEESSQLDWDQMPARVEAVIEERIERLPNELREILTSASVEGQNFTVEVLARLQEVEKRNLLKNLSRELEKRHQLVREAGEIKLGKLILSQYTFSHALFQRYLYNSLGTGERRLLHGEIAKYLEELYTNNLDKIVVHLANHYSEAGNTEKAVEYLKQAGETAFSLTAFKEATELLEQALALLKVDDIDKANAFRIDLEWLLGEIFYYMNQNDLATQHYQASLHLARILDNSSSIVGALTSLSSIQWQRRDYSSAKTLLKEALDLAQKINNKQQIGVALRNLGVIYGREDHPEEALKHYEDAYTLAVEVNDRRGQAASLNNLAGLYSSVFGDHLKALATYEKALEIAIADNRLPGQALYLGSIGQIYRRLGDYQHARSYTAESLKFYININNQLMEGSRHIALGVIAINMEDDLIATKYINRGIELVDEAKSYADVVWGRSWLALCYLHKDKFENALDLVSAALQVAEQHEDVIQRDHVFSELLLKAAILLRMGRNDEARSLFSTELERATQELATKRWAMKYHRAFALAGLALTSSPEIQISRITQTVEAYNTAIDYCTSKGVVADAVFILRELRKADPSDILAPVEEVLTRAIT